MAQFETTSNARGPVTHLVSLKMQEINPASLHYVHQPFTLCSLMLMFKCRTEASWIRVQTSPLLLGHICQTQGPGAGSGVGGWSVGVN